MYFGESSLFGVVLMAGYSDGSMRRWNVKASACCLLLTSKLFSTSCSLRLLLCFLLLVVLFLSFLAESWNRASCCCGRTTISV